MSEYNCRFCDRSFSSKQGRGIHRGNQHRDEHPLYDREYLEREYLIKEKTLAEIADEIDVGSTTVEDQFKKLGIETRSRGEARSLHLLSDEAHEKLKDEQWLRQEYEKKNRSTVDIAEDVNSNPTTVSNHLRKHGIELRTNSEARRIDQLPPEARKKLDNEQWLRQEYDEKERTIVDIARQLNAGRSAVNAALHRQGIETRSCSEAAKLLERTGEDNPHWKGGEENYYGPNWREQREKARERDGHQCQWCSMTDDEHLERHGRELDVHHIAPRRLWEGKETQNRLGNLITLCLECHKMVEYPSMDLTPPDKWTPQVKWSIRFREGRASKAPS
jgi:5-methylcytosine-specific restriction endonuclease McrA/predicted DNA-binding protein YlxM (UPF0122 family)